MLRRPIEITSFISTSVGPAKRYFHESSQHTACKFFRNILSINVISIEIDFSFKNAVNVYIVDKYNRD
jgi:hypothetical protein